MFMALYYLSDTAIDVQRANCTTYSIQNTDAPYASYEI